MAADSNGAISPSATYRVQLNASFPFSGAADIAPYLSRLGISHLYCSPYLQAARGSTHGYDVVDPTRVNRELGGEEAHAKFCQALGESGIGQLLDFVPNHMSVADAANTWWRDVLANGPASPYATYFDVDWVGGEEENRNRILLPILEDHYGRMLDAGRIRLERIGDEFVIRYQQDTFPLSPRTLAEILRPAAEQVGSDALAYIADSFASLPHATTTDRKLVDRRRRDAAVLQSMLRTVIHDQPDAAGAIDAAVTKISYDAHALDELLKRQNYRLAFWRTAGEEIDYRRFFDVTGLASLRIEDEHVFADVHTLVLDWLKQGVIDGLRIDHIDGLRDPYAYLLRLREHAPRAWVVVEKILAADERLPANWPVQGTTGYEFLNVAMGLLVDPRGEAELNQLYAELTGETHDWGKLLHEKKRLVLQELFAADVRRLVASFLSICKTSRRFRDYTRREVTELIVEAIVQLPVYRTYVRAGDRYVGEDDERRVSTLVQSLHDARPDIDKELIDLLSDVLLLKHRGDDESEFVMRFQQVTGPAMAKGAEDTAFYCYHRLVAINEVGGDPGRFGATLDSFHALCAEIQSLRPQSLLATTTHDTKRSEDVRARLAVLSEVPGEWAGAVRRWLARGEAFRRNDLPDANTLYLLFQTLVGAWPIEEARLSAYMLKAAREAKTHTSWTAPSAEFEAALAAYINAIYADRAFMDDIAAFAQSIKFAGQVNSLAQTLWKLTAPGIPDIYQGQELWDLSLVDPDNRRAVDYARRMRYLDELESLALRAIKERWNDGLPKLWVIRQSLALRRRRSQAFGTEGAYEPLAATGKYADHVVAFVRGGTVASIAPRWTLRNQGNWEDTHLSFPIGTWRNVLTGEEHSQQVALGKLLGNFPVALMERIADLQ